MPDPTREQAIEAYRREECVEVPEYELAVGPGGFECVLTEPEDRTFYRDAKPLLDELNRLHTLLTRDGRLRERLENLCATAITVGHPEARELARYIEAALKED